MNSSSSLARRAAAVFGVAVLALVGSVTSASALTRIMPDRQALVGNVVVWGNTTLANGTAFSLTCGDMSAPVAGNVADRSYIFRTCNYATPGTYTATLTVGGESASVEVVVVDPPANSADRRNARINAAIEDGLRYLYYSQCNRATAYDTIFTTWPGCFSNNNFQYAYAALAVQAIQNHGHSITSPDSDIYKAVLQRGLNYLFDRLVQRDLTPCDEDPTAGVRNPCVNVAAPVAVGLSAPADGDDGYATGVFAAAIAGAAGANPGAVVGAGIGANNANFVVGKTYAEVLQRIVNALAWGQSDSGGGEGGWYYYLQAGSESDGSTMGWALLGLIDAEAAGATVPAWVKTQLAKVLNVQFAADGTLTYQYYYPSFGTNGSMTKVGIGLQALAFIGLDATEARAAKAITYITRNWTNQVDASDGFQCFGGAPSNTNKGCGYSMFNIFKGLKFLGVNTLPGIGRPAGPGSILADDWYADYVDNLLTNQHLPSDATRGEWSADFTATSMGWSCCDSNTTGITALAELMLAPVAFVQPDLTKFSTLGLSPQSAVNPVGTDHTVTAKAESASGAPVPGVTVNFQVLSGPNAGKNGQDTTDANGEAHFTYHDDGGAGTDTIQAFIGTAGSNQVTKTWGGITCDVNNDGKVTTADLQLIRARNGQVANASNSIYDANKDGRINLTDVAYCQRRLTP